MRVQRLAAKGFTTYEEGLEVRLPPAGLVLVTGPNGAGKSSLVEVVSYAAWGKTLRGTDPRREDGPGIAEVDSSLLMARRAWKGDGKPARLYLHEQDHESSTKAQEAVSQLLDWDVWRRACTFSSADAASFAAATDAERKRLLELAFGLGRIDAAHAAALTDRKAVKQEVQVRQLQVSQAEGAAAQASKAWEQSKINLSKVAGPEALEKAQLAQLAADDALALHRGAAERLEDLYQELRQVAEDRRRAFSKAEEALEHATRSTCALCQRPFEVSAKLVRRAESEVAACRQSLEEADRAHWAARQDAQGARQDTRRLEDEADKARRLRERLEHLLESSEAQVTAAEGEARERAIALEAAQADLADAQAALALQEAVCTALGPRGARSRALAEALAGLEARANEWLAEVCLGNLWVEISPTTTRASGAVAEVVSLQVYGAGGGHGYQAASAGERRRIDVALMLALAEQASAAHGIADATLWFDEVFDALDEEGVEAVSGAIQRLAEDRCVVVVSHSQAAIDGLRPALRLQVNGGKVTAR